MKNILKALFNKKVKKYTHAGLKRLKWGLPWWLSVKESACNAGDAGDVGNVGLVPESERSSGGENGNSFQYSCLKNPMDRETWQAAVQRVAKSQTWLSTHTHTHNELWTRQEDTEYLQEVEWRFIYMRGGGRWAHRRKYFSTIFQLLFLSFANLSSSSNSGYWATFFSVWIPFLSVKWYWLTFQFAYAEYMQILSSFPKFLQL